MAKDIVIMKDGTSMIGTVLDKQFSLKTNFGALVKNQRSQLTDIDFSVDGSPGHDRLILPDFSVLSGTVQNQAISLQLQAGNQIISIPTADITSIRFNHAP